MLWSAKYNCFYLPTEGALAQDPDAILVSEAVFNTFGLGFPPEGKTRIVGDGGMPEWGDVPGPTNAEKLSSALSTLSVDYKKDIAELNTAYLAAIVSDGPSEVTKQQIVRDQISDRKSKYAADVAAEKDKYPT